MAVSCFSVAQGRATKFGQKIYKRVRQKIYKRPKDFSIPIKQQHGANHDAFCPNDVRKKLRSRVIFIA